MKKYNFEQVKKDRVQGVVATISNSTVHIPKALAQEYSFDKYEFVNVHFDKNNRVIGIELLEIPGPNSFKLTTTTNKGCTFSSKGLVQNFGVPKGKYKIKEFKENFLILKNEKR
jgi:hypothetical protein